MPIVTKQEFAEWKQHPVTEAFFEAAGQRVVDAKDILGQSAGLDGVNDNFYRGFIAAYEEMRFFRPEDDE